MISDHWRNEAVVCQLHMLCSLTKDLKIVITIIWEIMFRAPDKNRLIKEITRKHLSLETNESSELH